MKTFKGTGTVMSLSRGWGRGEWELERELGGVCSKDDQGSLCVFRQPSGRDACPTATGEPNPIALRASVPLIPPPRAFMFSMLCRSHMKN